MGTVEVIKGDLIELARSGEFDAIAHGCNCFHTMGSGIAMKMRELTNEECLEADRKTPYGDINKLGGMSSCKVTALNGKEFDVFNIYTQYTFASRKHPDSGKEVYVHWLSVYDALVDLLLFSQQDKSDAVIAIPEIGCGLARGDRDDLMLVADQAVSHARDMSSPALKPARLVIVQYNG